MNMVGKVLVAPPAQDDNFWSRSVIYIYEQNLNSISGLILNKSSDRTVSQLAEHHDLGYNGDDLIYIGGPVNPSYLIMLHSDEWTSNNTIHVLKEISISSDHNMLKRISDGDRPERWKMFLGMSGWSPNQLEGEISGHHPWNKKKSWLVAEPNMDIIFEKNPDKMWKKAIDLAVQEITESYFAIY